MGAFARRPVPLAETNASTRNDGRVLVLGLLIALGIIGGMYMAAGTIAMAASVIAFIAAIISPPVGLVVLAVMGPLRPPLTIPAPGFNAILVASLVFGCVARISIERSQIRFRAPLLILFGLTLYIVVQQLPEMLDGWQGDHGHLVGFQLFQLLTGLGTILAAAFVIRGHSPNPYLIALLIAAAIAAALAILTFDGAPEGRLANLIPVADEGERATGPFGNPNYFGQCLAYATILALAWLARDRSRRLWIGLVPVVALLGYALALSLSRGAAAALFAGLVVLAFTRSRRTGIAAIVVGTILVLFVYPLFVEWRLTNLTGDASFAAYAEMASSDEGRLEAVLSGPALFLLSPVFGIGFGNYLFMSPLVSADGHAHVAHNWYMTLLAEQGIIGIGLWVLLLVAVWSWLRSRPGTPRTVGYAMLAAFAAGSMFLQPPTAFQLAVLPAIVLVATLVGEWAPVGGRTQARQATVPVRRPSARSVRAPRGTPIPADPG